MVVMLDRWEPVVDLKQTIPRYKPYVFPPCSCYSISRPNLPDST